MNCKFCSNFVPDGSESCPVCGRRPEEEPIGELLAKANNGTLAVAAEEADKAKETGKAKKTSLKGPLATIIASIAGWIALTAKGLFGKAGTIFDDAKTTFNAWFGKDVTTPGSNSEFVGGSASNDPEGKLFILEVAAVAIVAIISIVGLVWLVKRFINKIKK